MSFICSYISLLVLTLFSNVVSLTISNSVGIYTLFTLYRFLNDGYKFLLDHSKEIIEFEHFYTYAESIGKGFTVPMQYTQRYHYDTQIEYHKDCIDFINEKKKRFDE